MQYNDELRNYTLSATGDLLITRRMSPYDEDAYCKLWDVIRSASVRFTNLETVVHEYEDSPSVESGGTYTHVSPWIVDEIKWAGFNILSRANNHALDYTIDGLRRTSALLDAAFLCHAGTGENLAEARAPRYLDLKEGRVALMSAISTDGNAGRAGDQKADIQGRPGVNPIRYKTSYVLDERRLEALRDVSEALGFEDAKEAAVRHGRGNPDRPGELSFLGKRFHTGMTSGTVNDVNDRDVAENLKWVREARQQADIVVYSLHCHEGSVDRWQPADFHQSFAHQCIDAGTDSFIGHGPHCLRGLEIYRNRPIFYSLGNFFFQNDSIRKQPADIYERYGVDYGAPTGDLFTKRSKGDMVSFPADRKFWEAFVPFCRYEGGDLVECKLYPIVLGFGKGRTVRGRPLLAEGEDADRILGLVRDLSLPFGTRITIADGIGTVAL